MSSSAPVPSPVPGISPGARLGPYEISSQLGAGGMGTVYRARDTRLDRIVAIKVLTPALIASADAKARFEREARAISQLQHPHICVLFDVGQQGGIDFLVMEYLEGETLADRLSKGTLPLAQALRIATEIAEALDKAHRIGIVHRDLKPGNIMLTKGGAKLMDFGLAKPTGRIAGGASNSDPLTPSTPTLSLAALTSPASPLTQQGTVVGTFRYLAPELLQGAEADVRSDVFAFGCVLYEMLAGKPAFTGKNQASVIASILALDPPPVSSLQPLTPAAVDQLTANCLTKEPDERIQSAHDLVLQLRMLAATPAESSAKVSATAATTDSRVVLGWVMAVMFAITALAVTIGWLREPAQPQYSTHAYLLR